MTNTTLKGLSEKTQEQMKQYESYQPSKSVTAAQQTFEATQAAKPQAYKSQYDGQIQSAYDKIMNRQDFSYDLNADPQYQQYKNQFVNQGRRAMMDAQGQAAALTGGYGNSWAATAGSQAYQEYLQGLNEVIPQLYQQAYDRYDRQGQELLTQYETALSADELAYSRWADAYSRWASELDRAQNTYNTERDYDYGQFSDNRNYWQSLAQLENNNYWQGRDQAYQLALTMIQAGKTPSADMLYAAGISDADLATLQSMYKKKSGGGKKAGTLSATDVLALQNAYVSDGLKGYNQMAASIQESKGVSAKEIDAARSLIGKYNLQDRIAEIKRNAQKNLND